jgi:hypothetical protein
MVPRDGIEPSTQSSSGFCSTTELPRHIIIVFVKNIFLSILKKLKLLDGMLDINELD